MKTNTPQSPATDSPAHTPEPWNVERPFQEPGVYIAGPNTGLIAKLYEPDARLYNGDKLVSIDGNAARIVACVNACEGISDPVAQIKALRDALAVAEPYVAMMNGAMFDREKQISAHNSVREALANFSKGGAK